MLRAKDEDDVFGVHFKPFFSYIVIFLSSPSLFWCLGKTGGILYLLLSWGSVQNREENTKGDFERLGCSKRHLVYNVYGKITKNIYSWKQKVYEVVVGGEGVTEMESILSPSVSGFRLNWFNGASSYHSKKVSDYFSCLQPMLCLGP